MPPALTDSLAIFRLPNANQARLIRGTCSPVLQSLKSLFSQNAFVISPFNKKDLTFAITAPVINDFNPAHNIDFTFHFSKKQYTTLTNRHYLNIVNEAVRVMKQQQGLSKVVLSRTKSVSLISFDPVKLFEQLTIAFPNAFVYLVSTAKTGTWIGATPELLIGSNRYMLSTVALAGTLPNLPDAEWAQKEKDEQHLVEVYIESILNKQRLTYQKFGPQNIISGNLKHLFTQYDVIPPTAKTAHAIAKLTSALNPTSAVCGMNKQLALKFIAEHEGYNRNFYSGFAGVLTPSDQQLFVNIRCMEWQSQKATLFAGAGITQYSNAPAELVETERKINALLQFLQ